MSNRTPGLETLSVHAGTPPDPTTGARQMPIYQTSSFVFDDADHAASLFNLQLPGFIYSRLTNPTVSALEERIAALEDGRGATATASGHAAQILALFPLMHPGDEIIAANPDQVEKVKAKPTLAGWFVGQVMKATRGKANPQMVNELLRKKLG